VATVVFQDSAGRPLVGAVVSIAAAPGEFRDIGMITDNHGEISVAAPQAGDYEFVVFRAGNAQNVRARIAGTDERLTIIVD
jgi:uncharacterized surface anchored protein